MATRQKQNGSMMNSLLMFFKKNLLVILTVVGVVVGLALGIGIREARPSSDAVMWIGLPGEVYMRMLKMMILPLIISTVITGTASLNPRTQGRISLVSVVYIVISNTIPPIIGAIVVVIINPVISNTSPPITGVLITVIMNPGADVIRSSQVNATTSHVMQTQDIFADLIRNLFPDNLITAAFQQTMTEYKYKNASSSDTLVIDKKQLGRTNGTNVLGLIICCTLFGIGTSSVGDQGKPFLKFFRSASEIILKILRWLIWFTPIGVASLIATVLAATPDISATFRRLGMFILATLLGLGLMMFVIVPALYLLIIRKNPVKFFSNLLRPLMITFATASSAIAIPDTLFSMEKKNNIDKRISRFVVPFSSALNKSGSALYIAASCVFICQLENVPTTPAQVTIIIILTALSTFAVPSVPSAGIVTIIILLTAMNIPAKSVGLLLAVEWFLDRCRTAGNLYGQILCVAVTQKFANLPPREKDGDSNMDEVDLEIVIDQEKPKMNGTTGHEGEALLTMNVPNGIKM